MKRKETEIMREEEKVRERAREKIYFVVRFFRN